MKTIIALALLCSTAAAQDAFKDALKDKSTWGAWATVPGEHIVDGYVAEDTFNDRPADEAKYSFVAKAIGSHCLYENAFVTKDGRQIPYEITGNYDMATKKYTWEFRTTELFTGQFQFHVRTVCASTEQDDVPLAVPVIRGGSNTSGTVEGAVACLGGGFTWLPRPDGKCYMVDKPAR